EAVFWTFLFPILLAVCLGLAFRQTPAETVPVGVASGAGAESVVRTLLASPSLKVRTCSEADGRNALRAGRIAVLVVPGRAAGAPTYVFDPTRPDSRGARREVDDLLQRAAGRADVLGPKLVEMREPGARYIDFLIPGILGMNVM